jgi:diaminohydroxyphosphoribosylaminopyrimidine deaminase/5-amino-6-(5-phosphoribosylamino)uracil reductase
VPPTARVLTDGGTTLHITDDIDLHDLLGDLYARGIQSIIVEGGSLIHSEFIRHRLWQKMIVFVGPILVGGAEAPSIFAADPVQRLTDAYRFRFDRVELVGGDLMITCYPANS